MAVVLTNVVQQSTSGNDCGEGLLGCGQPRSSASPTLLEPPKCALHNIPYTGEARIEMQPPWATLTSIGIHQPFTERVHGISNDEGGYPDPINHDAVAASILRHTQSKLLENICFMTEPVVPDFHINKVARVIGVYTAVRPSTSISCL